MKYVNLGRSGLKVSRICLGTMAYANGAGGAHPWALNEEASQPFFSARLKPHQFLRHRERLFVRYEQRISGPGGEEIRQARRIGDRHQSARRNAARRSERQRLVAQSDPDRDRS